MNEHEELFTNPQIRTDLLPQVEKLDMVPLEKSYKTLRYISGSVIAAVLLLVSWGVGFIEPRTWPYGMYGAVLVTLFAIWIIVYYGRSYHYMSYAMREKDISFSSGLLWRSVTTVPFNRVQHCDIKQGILDRKFGLARLTIYTAGGQNTDLVIPGLLPETAEKMKVYILSSTEQSSESE